MRGVTSPSPLSIGRGSAHQMSPDKKQSAYLVYLPACCSSNEWIAAVFLLQFVLLFARMVNGIKAQTSEMLLLCRNREEKNNHL